MTAPNLFNTPPTHLSAGAVVINSAGEILCHHFDKTPGEGLPDIYVLMRETVEDNEPLEATVARGLLEEFGVTGKIIKYLGSIISHYPEEDTQLPLTEKTTLYFLVSLKSMDESLRDQSDPEKDSHLEWRPVSFLIEKMDDQLRRYPNRTDLCESSILKKLPSSLDPRLIFDSRP